MEETKPLTEDEINEKYYAKVNVIQIARAKSGLKPLVFGDNPKNIYSSKKIKNDN